MSLQDIVILVHNGEYGRAIASLEQAASDESKSALERVECYKWLAECNTRLEDHQEAGNKYLDAIRIILSQQMDGRSKAKFSLPLCEKALGCFKQGGDSADVLVAARLKQYLLGLSRQP